VPFPPPLLLLPLPLVELGFVAPDELDAPALPPAPLPPFGVALLPLQAETMVASATPTVTAASPPSVLFMDDLAADARGLLGGAHALNLRTTDGVRVVGARQSPHGRGVQRT
jgi:hypothetical protein